jgi:23S rRNA (uracil1939-C5)-methyltransferase
VDRIRTVVHNISRRKAAVAVGERERIVSGQGWLEERIGPHSFRISANSFFQTNTRAAQRLYETVVAFAGLTGTERVLDLYSGTGTIPIFLADRAQRVTGIEISEAAVQDARRNCTENGIHNCRFICGDLRRALSEVEERPDVLIIDPPRAGMHKDVLRQVLDLSASRIVYVSCNPATLARDLALMSPAYDPLRVQPVDMFPNTYHIEAVAELAARRG